MPRLSRGAWYATLFLSVILLAVTACAGDEVPAPSQPTQAAEVVIFSTEEPTVVGPKAPTSQTIATPTPAVTVGVGAQSAIVEGVSQETASISGPAEFNLDRSPDENPLTGLKVDDQSLIQRRPLLVRVGNDVDARPQVGLNEADIVYEELVEWWVTRFSALYLSQDLDMIAPIRSVRLINLQLAPQYQAALAHSGGSDPVRWQLEKSKIISLDEYFNSSLYFYRENEGYTTRLAFDATVARDYLLDEGLESDVSLRGFVFSQKLDLDNLPEEAVGEAQEIIIPYPAQTSEARWQYDEDSGRYLRFTTGEPMEDFDGNQISAANVIIYFAEHQKTDIVEDANGATSVNTIVNGFGTAWLLRDGKILKGNWETDGQQTPNFIFNDGQPMPLKPGNTWIAVVSLSYLIEIDGESHSRLGETEADETEVTSETTVTPTVEPAATLTPIGARARPTATPASE